MMLTVRKRILAALLIAAVAALIGCGPKNAANNGKGEQPHRIIWYNSATPSRDNDLVFEKISELTLEKINATVKCIPIKSTEYAEKMKMLIAANEKFDICFMSLNTNFATFVAQDIFLPLDDLLASKGKDILNLIPKGIFAATTINNKIYSVPVLKDWARHSGIQYKPALVKKYGLDASNIKSLAELEPMLQAVKDNEPNYMPLLGRGNSPLFRLLPFESIAGSSVAAFRFDDYSKVINKFDTDEAREYFKLMREWYLKEFVRKDAATATNDEDYYNTHNYFAAYTEDLPYSSLKWNLGFFKDDESRYVDFVSWLDPIITTGDVQGSTQAIAETSGNPEKAMEFLNLLYVDKEIKNLVTLGIEGKHYIAVGENQSKLPEGVSKSVDTGYAPSAEFCVGNRFLSLVGSNTPQDIWEKYQEYNEKAVVSEALGFAFDSSAVSTQIAAIENVYQEFMPALLVGAVEPEAALSRALEKFKIAGIDAVLNEIQNQYDAWKNQK